MLASPRRILSPDLGTFVSRFCVSTLRPNREDYQKTLNYEIGFLGLGIPRGWLLGRLWQLDYVQPWSPEHLSNGFSDASHCRISVQATETMGKLVGQRKAVSRSISVVPCMDTSEHIAWLF